MAKRLKPVSLKVVTVLYFKKPGDLWIKKDPKQATRSSEAYTLDMLERIIFHNEQKDPLCRPFLGFRKGSIGSEDESDLCTEAEALEYLYVKKIVVWFFRNREDRDSGDLSRSVNHQDYTKYEVLARAIEKSTLYWWEYISDKGVHFAHSGEALAYLK